MSYKFESEVTKALGELLETGTNYDVIIYVGEKPDFKEFHAHSIFLSCRSVHFNETLSANNVEKKDGKYIIKKSNITPQAFNVIIKYLYTGHFNMTNKNGIEMLNIIVASDDLKLNQIIKVAEDIFIENHQKFVRIDPVEILQIVCCHQIFSNIQKLCFEMIYSEPEILFNSVKFINLPASLLEIILKRDDLNLSEIEVWENLIKWGLAQEKTLKKDASKWCREDFNVLKRILYKFIPLIRFGEISSEDYFDKVRLYEEILSKELQEEILKFHMVPGYKPTLNNFSQQRYPNSVLVNQKHIEIFTNWINQRAVGRYNFRLLYRASKDGNTTAAFHAKCDNKGATIFIAKIKNSEQIVGGYNPLFWDLSDTYKSTHDSFVFLFTDRMNLQTAKLGYSNGNPYSIGCFPVHGPSFSGVFYLCFRNGYLYGNYHDVYSSYPKINGLPIGQINIDDYEVFQVTKK